MSDLISRQAVIDLIMENDPFWCEGMTRTILDGINRLPSVDAVPVIRCKDCIRYREYTYLGTQKVYVCERDRRKRIYGMNADDYCSRAERRKE